MLPTQVTYWANKEQARHNRETERLTKIDQSIARQNADTNVLNAQTQARQASVAEADLKNKTISAAAQSINAQTNREQLDINRQSVQAAERQAAASESQAVSAAKQAAASTLTAQATAQKSASEVEYNKARTEYTQLESEMYIPAKVVTVGKDAAGLFSTIKTGVTKLLKGK